MRLLSKKVNLVPDNNDIPLHLCILLIGERSFQVAAPALWNVLPREIRSITDLGIFKCHLKTHLFREAFY